MSTLSRFHFVNAADALARTGRDVRLYTADPKAQSVSARVVRPSPSIVIGYAAHRILPIVRLEQWLVRAFDAAVAGEVARGRTSGFHGGSLYCLQSLLAARTHGIPCVVERSGAHIRVQRRLMAEERARLGIAARAWRSYYDSQDAETRMLAEYSAADRIIVSSTFVRNTFIEEGVSPRKILVAPLGANFPTRSWKPRPLAPFTALSVGNEPERKGIGDLLKAWRIARLSGGRLVLRAPVLDPWRQWLGDDVDVLPPMSHVALQQVFGEASVFCLLSIEDGFGMVVGEAMAFGCPVIVSRNVGAKDMVDEGVDGFIVDIRSPEQVAEKLTFLRENPDVLQEMSRNALRKAKQFSWDRYAAAVNAVWRDLAVDRCGEVACE